MVEQNPARRQSPLAMFAGVAAATMVQATRMAISAGGRPLERFDEGILLSSVTFAAKGVVPLRDFYTPYGWGLGLPGAALRTIGLDGVFATRILYGSAAVLVVIAAAVVARMVAGQLAAVVAAVAAMSSGTARYAIPTLAILVASFLSLRREERSAGAVPGVGVAVLLGATSAIRAEYAAFSIVWAVVLLVIVGRHAWRPAFAAPAVALGPYACIGLLGGAEGMRRAWTYAAVGYGEYRRIPWDPTAPVRWLVDVDPVAGMVTVGYGSALIGAVLLAACAVRPRLLRPEVPRWLVAFLAIVLFCLTWSHSVRFSATQAAELFPLALVAGVVATDRLLRVRRCLLTVAFAGAVGWAIYTTARVIEPPDGKRTDLPQLAVVPLRPAEEVSLRALRQWWTADDHPSGRVFVVNLRNDLTAANEVIVYWWLDARPAAWPTTFDPGLADQVEVHDAVIHDLCDHRLPPVVRHTAVYGNAELDGRLHFSRRLDEFIALNYDVVAGAPLYDMLERRGSTCVRPERVDDASLRRRRDDLRGRNDLTASAALSALLADRATARAAPPDPADLAAAETGGFAVNGGAGR